MRGQEPPHVGFGLVAGPVRRVTVVDPHHGPVRHYVAGHPALDVHGLEGLPVPAAVHHGLPVLVAVQGVQQPSQAVDGVASHPRPGRVGPGAGQGHLKAHRPLAARFDGSTGRLSEDGHITVQQVRSLGEQLPKAVVGDGHFLAGV